MQLQYPCLQSSITQLSTAFPICAPIYLRQKCTCFTLFILAGKDNASEVTRDLNLIDYRCFIEGRNQREKRYSNVIVPQQDTFLLSVSIQNLRDKLKVIFLYVISYCKLFFTTTNLWETGSAYYTDKCEIFTSSWFLSPIVVIWKWIISYSLFSNCRLLATKKKIEKEGRT